MRIQHNISAMNAYRNFSSNTSKLSKNLEKLSTGYKINRAGDDAAGLAISEKMRAQISGIEGATKNAKDGISLIQTAEGALTEVHDMLNRMTTLAEQSANGTYDDKVDRNQLQKEVDALKSEIDRIADSTNYNGIKLLDGSLSGAGNVKGNVTMSDTVATQATSKTTAVSGGAITYGANGAGNAVATGTAGTLVSGLKYGQGKDTISVNVSWNEGDETKTASIDFKLGTNATTITSGYTGAASDVNYLQGADGTKYQLGTAGTITDEELANAINSEIAKHSDLKNAFAGAEIEKDAAGTSTNKLLLTGKQAGSNSATVNSIDFRLTTRDSEGNVSGTTSLGATLDADGVTAGKDVQQKLSLSNVKVLNGAQFATFTEDEKANAIRDNTFEVDGHKFILYAADTANNVNEMKKYAGSDVNFIQLDGGNQNASNAATNAATLSDYVGSGTVVTGYEEATNAGNLTGNYTAPTGGVNFETDAKTIAAELSRVTGRDFGVLTSQGAETEHNTAGDVETVAAGATSVTIAGTEITGLTAGNAVGYKTATQSADIVLSGKEKLSPEGKDLTLQIGDTSEKFNKMSVSVKDMHSASIGIGDVDISTQDGAAKALDQIKAAVNFVSDQRGSLGALQNRLDHTINNLGVMKENITSSESLIRDTDVAEEMMTYTKNNILNQSAQAMLAQANQLPQGVLQLLG